MLENLTLSVFAEHLYSKFRAQLDGAQAIELELIQAEDAGSTPQQEQFSLIFQGPLELFLPQRTYTLSHAQLGELGLFLVPVAREKEGYHYQAVFNRILRP